ncbi:MAG: DUF3015 family protein [Moraxella sp.]|nr:DUF3015 family protein [Moraxella sp.]
MLKKALIATAITAVALSSTAHAGQKSGRSIEQVYKQCGIGGALFGNKSEILAIISNVTWDLGTTAAISDSASPDTCKGGDVRAAVLINEAFPSVEKDLAAGEGAYINALANVAQCSSVDAVRTSYGKYAQSSAYETASQAQNGEVLFGLVQQHCGA